MGRMFQILIGIAMLCGAAYTTKENLRYNSDGIRVIGSVVRVMNRVEVDERSFSATQAPVIEFVPDGSSEKRMFRSSIWSSALFSPKVGSSVRVLYLEGEPENARIDSWAQWILPGVLALVGVACLMGWTRTDHGRFGFRWTDD